MAMLSPSIFNDVIGPVMRGCSSSHVAAAWRLGRLLRMGTPGSIAQVHVTFDPNGALVASYHGHGSDMGLICGLLGMSLTDLDVTDVFRIARQRELQVDFSVQACGATHPNYYRMQVVQVGGESHVWEGISIGGGMITLCGFDGFPVSIDGSYYELLLLTTAPAADMASILGEEEDLLLVDAIERTHARMLHIRSDKKFAPDFLSAARQVSNADCCVCLEPILPTPAPLRPCVPFATAADMLAFYKDDAPPLWKIALEYESMRGGISERQVYQMMESIADIMRSSVEFGLAGTCCEDRILGPQAHLLDASQAAQTLTGGVLHAVIRNITAVMEAKSAMGVIVAAPTAGSCGCLAGTVSAVCDTLHLGPDDMIKGLLAAGMIGVFIAGQATFAAEVAGCQAECGAGSAMTAAALVQMMGGSALQCADAASMALQNVTGLACDPVANRVEVPCLGKNIMAGSNALSCAGVVMAGFDKVIPLDETIVAMFAVGKALPIELRCTHGGLGLTETSRQIEERLKRVRAE